MPGGRLHPRRGARTTLTLAAVVCMLAVSAELAHEAAAADPDPDPRIVGGAPTTIDQYPWQVALAYNDTLLPGLDGFQRQVCGGTLVAPTIVITAAHCVFNNPPPPPGPGIPGFNPASNFEVFTGRTNLASNEGQVIEVAEIYYFEGTPGAPALQAQSSDANPATGQLFSLVPAQWDAVFLRLAQPSTTGTPIKIAGPREAATWAPGQTALISGWGALSLTGPFPDQLQAAQVKIIEDSSCVGAYQAVIAVVPEVIVCAGIFPQGGTDICLRDSGGPLVVPVLQKARAANAVRLVGDTSFGTCAQPAFPGVYGRLAADPMRSAFRAGIQQVAGVDVVGSGAEALDSDPPETTITKHPKKKVETNQNKVKAKFKFGADEPGTFQCKIDGGAFKGCSSPFSKPVARGSHKFQVRAVDEQGNVDPTPAKFGWKVKAVGPRARG